MRSALHYEKLWESFKEGDRAAFAEIYNKHISILLNYGSKISSDSALVEDCIQDLFIDLWQSRTRLSSTTSVKFYLFKALRNRIYRYHSASSPGIESLEAYAGVLNDSCYEDQIIQMEIESFQMEQLRKQIDDLPLRQKEAINLRYYHNFSNDEIARLMGVNYTSACKFIYSGLKKLMENLKRK